MPAYKNFLGEDFYYVTVYSPDYRPNRFFEIDMCGKTIPNPKYEMFRDNNPVYVFEYVSSGVGWIDTEGKRYKVSAGDFYLLRRGFSGHYFADRSEPYEKIWVNARGTLVDDVTSMYGLDGTVTIFHCPDIRIKRAILAIHNVLSAKGLDIKEAQRIASVKLVEILSMVGNNKQVNESVTSNRVKPADFIRNYLSDHIYDDVRLSDIADQLYMHEATVIRIFRETYGVTPMKYLNALRINAAKGMLYECGRTKYIAESLRFSDVAYFSNCFKKETGMTPSQYRSMVRGRTDSQIFHNFE